MLEQARTLFKDLNNEMNDYVGTLNHHFTGKQTRLMGKRPMN